MSITIQLSPELQARLAAAAKHSGRSESDMVASAIEELLEDMEDIKAAEEVLNNPSERRWTLEEVMSGKDLEH